MTARLGSLVLLAATALPAPARAEGRTVSGIVRYAGPPRAAHPLPVTQDPGVCGKTRPDETLLLDGAGGVQNAVVSLADVPGGAKPPPGTAKLDQKQCQFVPHVQAAPAGSSLVVGNNDGVLHNVHGWREGATLFNLALPSPDMQIKRKLLQPGLNEFRCDAGHVWMGAYVWTFDHPYYAVTDRAGRFSIEGVPPGTYVLRVWHEGWKRTDPANPAITAHVVVEQNVTVEAAKPVEVTIPLK